MIKKKKILIHYYIRILSLVASVFLLSMNAIVKRHHDRPIMIHDHFNHSFLFIFLFGSWNTNERNEEIIGWNENGRTAWIEKWSERFGTSLPISLCIRVIIARISCWFLSFCRALYLPSGNVYERSIVLGTTRWMMCRSKW